MGEKDNEKEKTKETTMVLDVDLQCCKCYKKVKKVLCKFPQIRDQVYDEKANKVTIKVVCCSPEKMMDKLCCKGGGSIKSIEIKPPSPSQKPNKKQAPAEPAPPQPMVYLPIVYCCTYCYHVHGGHPCYYGTPPPPCYETCCWGCGGGGSYKYYYTRVECFSEENPQGCSIL